MSKKSDPWITFATLVLAFYGMMMVISVAMGSAVSDATILIKTGIKELVFIAVGYFCMTWMSRKFSLEFLRGRNMKILVYITCAALLVCRLFKATGTSYGWWRVTIAGVEVGLQPAEFAKIVGILVIACYLGDNHKIYKKVWNMVRVPVLSIAAFVAIILFVQKDFGSAMVVGLIALIVVMVPNHPQLKKIQILSVSVIALIALAIVIVVYTDLGEAIINALPNGYQKNRFLSAINPFLDKYGSGYQLVNGLIAFASGGWFGKGLGNSVRKYTQFPAAGTDSILSIIVEELGFVGFLVLIVLFGIIVFRLLNYAKKIKNEKAKIILVGVAMYFMVHIFFNIGGVTVAVPLTGIPLLMISSGGSSTISAMLALGISQALISQYKRGIIQ